MVDPRSAVKRMSTDTLQNWVTQTAVNISLPKNEDDPRVIADLIGAAEIDGSDFVSLNEPEIADLIPVKTPRFFHLRKYLRTLLNYLNPTQNNTPLGSTSKKQEITKDGPCLSSAVYTLTEITVAEKVKKPQCFAQTAVQPYYPVLWLPALEEKQREQIREKYTVYGCVQQVANMFHIARGINLKNTPSLHDVEEMAKRFVKKYPCTADEKEDANGNNYNSVLDKMRRKVYNMAKPGQKRKKYVEHSSTKLQDEMSRHLQKSLEGLKAKWDLEVNIILKYGEEKKLLNISLAWSLEKKTSEALQILPDLFAAGKSAPTGLKKSEMLLQFVDDLEKKEEAMQKSKKREVWLLGVPSHRKCFVLIKGQPLCELNSMVEAFFTLLSASYTFSVCYHECVGPAVMWLESAFLGDERVNTKDMTSCKKSIQSYLDFKEKLTSP